MSKRSLLRRFPINKSSTYVRSRYRQEIVPPRLHATPKKPGVASWQEVEEQPIAKLVG